MQCRIDDCDTPHCRKCGCHYEPWEQTRGGLCDDCIIEQSSDEASRITQNFNGNYEEAARFMGW